MVNSFFKNGDKAYSENLNDGVLVGNAFDWTVSIGLPGDNGGVFPNSSTVVKAKVADVYITLNSNLSIGSSIENSSGSSQVYRLTVYPNFNRFGGFKSISLTADSGVTFYIANKGGTSPIASNLDYDDLSNVPELKVLKEYDIVITIPSNKEVTGLEFVFQSSSADVSGSISQSNVTGLNNTISSIQNKNTQQDNRLSDLETVNAQILTYDLYSSNYNPNINSNVTISCRVKTITGEDVEGATLTLYKNGSSVGSATTSELGVATWTVNCSEWGIQHFSVKNQSIDIRVTGYIQTSVNNGMYIIYEYEDRVGLRIHIDTAINFTNAIRTINDWAIPHRLAPRYPIMIVCANGNNSTPNTAIGVSEDNALEHTQIICKSLTGSTISTQAYAYLEWDKKY